jgi:excisionase family DNA binding protein
MDPLEGLLTTEDVANYLKVDVVTVRRLVSRGELGAYRIGGEYRFTIRDIREYLERQHIPAKQIIVPAKPLATALPSVELEPVWNSVAPAFLRKLTRRAKLALKLAADEAHNFRQEQIGSEHLLLGLIREPEGVASQVLGELGVTFDKARQAIELMGGIGAGPDQQAQDVSEEARRAIELALEHQKRLNHHYMGTEHLLLGLIQDDGRVTRVLEGLGVTVERVSEQVSQKLEKM